MSSVLDKIRKLLRLSKSSNANEAAAAAAAAQRLMTEHQIAEAELGSSEEEDRPTIPDDPLETFGERSPAWKEVLSSQLSEMHGCHVWCESRWHQGKRVRRVRIAGRPSDVASVRYLYAWLTSSIVRLTAREGKGRGRQYAQSYRNGCLNGCLEAMWAARREARVKATAEALVRIDARADEARAERARAFGDLSKPRAPATFKYDRDAYELGHAAGRNLHTGAELSNAAGARLLGSGS